MKYRRFGKTEMNLSVLTFGCMQLPLTDEETATRTIHRAVELGINHLETARGYQDSEIRLGKALKSLRRDELYITTKIPPKDSEDEMRRAIEESLQRMDLDYMDNFDVHGINNEELLEQTLKSGTLKAIHKAMDEGLIRHLGFSGHGPLDIILAAIDTQEFESVNLHYYYVFQRNLPAIRRAAELDMGVFIISPTNMGGQLFKAPQKMEDLCAPYTPIEINQRFLLSMNEVHTLSCGPTYPNEFEPHLQAIEMVGPLTAHEREILSRLDSTFDILGNTYCSGCNDCLPCPQDVRIPEVLRLRNLTHSLNMEDYGRFRYQMFENAGHWYPGRKAKYCNECGDCLPRCPLQLNIPPLLFETHDRLFTGVEGQRRSTD